ncbi:zinc-dependent metalloprotease [Pseudocnuella soli]|uniref:zinc-dependent metalloprotease n=1 Tax=Pseudocnuella soli TaxID=2502779 RepID=UPI0010502D10|nr:zinc-dependent metalloprotease [Pseudocnuella soli]
MRLPFLLLFSLFSIQLLFAQKPEPAAADKTATGIAAFTKGMQSIPGYFPLYWDAQKGRMFLEIDKWNLEFLYYPSLAAGMGSNDIGLDRGRMGQQYVVQWERSGNKVLLVAQNYDYRANTTSEMERRAVAESFARSVLWGFEVAAQEGGKVLIDGTPFFLQQDAVGAAQAIARTRQGNYRIDPLRSAFYLPMTKNFPQNTEVEVTTTWTGEGAGAYLRQVVPVPGAVTLRQHFSFVQLPDGDYKPRVFDPRTGSGYISYFDYATPVDQPIEKRFIRRHRLEKRDPAAAMSEAVKPIIYYVDPGTPEPIRTALVEGTKWWNTAFEAAGYKNAFQVQLLPPDADPMDIRYNLVQWVHRSTRGWSYGGGITDPRTGEIIKGKVTLGSLRVRQDLLIAQGLLADFEDGKQLSPQIMELCMARMRQLAAHEVGHTLGLPHNYIASTQGRASVMDYPHPLAKLDAQGNVDLSDAYAEGIGEWDKAAVTMAYAQFAQGADEQKELSKLVEQYHQKGLSFMADQDARPAGSAHPAVHLWDNGSSAVAELDRVMKLRTAVLRNFSEKKIPIGAPLATLEEMLVPIYLMHRYQAEAAAKVLGGVTYTYALRGDGQKPVVMVPAKEQWGALDALLKTISPEQLALPEKALQLIPPRPYGYDKNERETFSGNTGLTFDPVAPAAVAANMTLSFVLHPERAARLVAHSALYPELPSLEAVIDRIVTATIKAPTKSGYAALLQQSVNNQVLKQLLLLANNKDAMPQVQAIAGIKLSELKQWLTAAPAKDVAWRAYYRYTLNQIKELEAGGEKLTVPGTLPIPDGAPIGATDEDWLNCSAGN